MAKRLIYIVVVLFSLGYILVWFNTRPLSEGPGESMTCQEAVVVAGEIAKTISGRGVLVTKRFSNIKTNGRQKIMTIEVKEGEKVDKGQCLARVEGDVKYDLELHNAKWEHINNEQVIKDIEKKLLVQKKLYEEGFVALNQIKGIQQELERRQTQKKILEKRIALFESKVGKQSGDGDAQGPGATVAGVCIKAPFSGTVLEIYKQEGDTLQQSDKPFSEQNGAVLLSLADISDFFVEYKVSEIYLEKIKLGQEVNVVFDSYPEKIYHGVVDKISSVASSSPRGGFSGQRELTYYLTKIKIVTPGPELKQGLSCRVSIETERKKSVPLAPIEALMKEGQEDFVFFIEGDSIERKPVKIGLVNETLFEVVDGLTPNDRICLNPYVVMEQEALQHKREKRNLLEKIFN